jgi:hypothetical protein
VLGWEFPTFPRPCPPPISRVTPDNLIQKELQWQSIRREPGPAGIVHKLRVRASKVPILPALQPASIDPGHAWHTPVKPTRMNLGRRTVGFPGTQMAQGERTKRARCHRHLRRFTLASSASVACLPERAKERRELNEDGWSGWAGVPTTGVHHGR